MDNSVAVPPDCIVGVEHEAKSGPFWAGNDRLGLALLTCLDKKPPIPLILQQGIARYINTPMVEKAKVIEKHRQEGVPLDLEEVCFQAARIIKEKNWKTCFVLAHKSDVAACKRILHGYGVLVTGEIVVNPNVW
ncbi:hypothetical protein A3C91_01765 [Candidatus Azambacteria bacterium RIFCSPHIGHO2_02_FULL_52_12]|uniref:Uncharacterized protein n=1 Tax=Candidatus Azambacteria bacterium RIFCSPLOWO2_01_FULL_46_25 TaxID=1797298 RepID=A0A1F5BVD2_9BACT|nr:MAG: hypothetical protein A3C91_01765 [Candidatus Azambacteria bacterium RIFCSPHIGHO2_02_FULL_52_12]OGD34570.1 MAG: hypothetical protein A2988_03625 [Candidatus Azambacteria bacterium RIFCSPLOWO2_01_FULL_46_25]OGD36444.1 MAG: hypothetical protein A2850_02125 [Candidatus Azambacteria bacterium RIFCSPHIGHO2_01_FULL_51_74]